MNLNSLLAFIKNPEIYKYLTVGILNAILVLALTIIFTSVFGIYYVISAVVSFELSIIVGFFMHDKWTFVNVRKTSKMYLRFIKYNTISLFGLAINVKLTAVEAIAAGCIPIVPDNSAHCETVPFSELRYKNDKDAKEKISDGINGNFDHFLPRLQEHILQFSEKNFQDKILGIIKNS